MKTRHSCFPLFLVSVIISGCSATKNVILFNEPIPISTARTEAYRIRGFSETSEVLFAVFRRGSRLTYAFWDTRGETRSINDSYSVYIYYNRTMMITVHGLKLEHDESITEPTVQFEECAVIAAENTTEMFVVPFYSDGRAYFVSSPTKDRVLGILWQYPRRTASVVRDVYNCESGNSKLNVTRKTSEILLDEPQTFEFDVSNVIQMFPVETKIHLRLQEKSVKSAALDNLSYVAYVHETTRYLVYHWQFDEEAVQKPYCVLEIYYKEDAERCDILKYPELRVINYVRSEEFGTTIVDGDNVFSLAARVDVSNGSVFVRLADSA